MIIFLHYVFIDFSFKSNIIFLIFWKMKTNKNITNCYVIMKEKNSCSILEQSKSDLKDFVT